MVTGAWKTKKDQSTKLKHWELNKVMTIATLRCWKLLRLRWHADDDDAIVVITTKPLRWWRQICIAQHSIKCAPIVFQSGPPLITLHWANEFDGGRKGGKSPPSPFCVPPKKSISSIRPCPMAGCLVFFWCRSCTHTHTQTCAHTHTPLWHLFSSLLLALRCRRHMANEKEPVPVCVYVCESTVGSVGG